MDRKNFFMNSSSKKTYQNWEKPKIQKSQMNGQTEISLHNQILRTEAKAKHL